MRKRKEQLIKSTEKLESSAQDLISTAVLITWINQYREQQALPQLSLEEAKLLVLLFNAEQLATIISTEKKVAENQLLTNVTFKESKVQINFRLARIQLEKRSIRITPAEQKLLATLCLNLEVPCSLDTLHTSIGNPKTNTPDSVRVLIYYLRHKMLRFYKELMDDPTAENELVPFISTIINVGYVLQLVPIYEIKKIWYTKPINARDD